MGRTKETSLRERLFFFSRKLCFLSSDWKDLCVKKYAKNLSKKRPLKNWKTLDWRHHHHGDASRDDDDDDDDDDDESERKRAFRVLPPLSFFRGDDEETKDNRAPLLSVGGNRRRRTWVRYVVLIVRELSSRRSSLPRDDLF